MSCELKIINLNQQNASGHPLTWSFLPNPATTFRMCIIGSSFCGKSNMLKNMLLRFGYWEYYDDGSDIFVVSSTLGDDSTWSSLKLPKYNTMSTYDPDLLKEVLEYSKTKSKNGVLIILDDMIGDNRAFNKNRTSLIDKIYTQGRHKRASIVCVSQMFKKLTHTIRTNSTHIIAFKLGSGSERRSFLEEQQAIDDIEEKYEYAVAKKYDFIYINKVEQRCFRAFEEEL